MLEASAAVDIVTTSEHGLDEPVAVQRHHPVRRPAAAPRPGPGVAADPPVLVLHDPTTAVDAVTEQRIADGLHAPPARHRSAAHHPGDHQQPGAAGPGRRRRAPAATGTSWRSAATRTWLPTRATGRRCCDDPAARLDRARGGGLAAPCCVRRRGALPRVSRCSPSRAWPGWSRPGCSGGSSTSSTDRRQPRGHRHPRPGSSAPPLVGGLATRCRSALLARAGRAGARRAARAGPRPGHAPATAPSSRPPAPETCFRASATTYASSRGRSPRSSRSCSTRHRGRLHGPGLFALDWRLGLAGLAAVPFYVLGCAGTSPGPAPTTAVSARPTASAPRRSSTGVHASRTLRAYGHRRRATRVRVDAVSWRSAQISIDVFRLLTRFFGRNNRAELVGLLLILVTGFVLVRSDEATGRRRDRGRALLPPAVQPDRRADDDLRRGAVGRRLADPARGTGAAAAASRRAALRAAGRRRPRASAASTTSTSRAGPRSTGRHRRRRPASGSPWSAPSGAGKSTLGLAVAGRLRPDPRGGADRRRTPRGRRGRRAAGRSPW